MTLLAYLGGDDHAHEVRLGALGATESADGSVGFGGITFDDPDGTLVVRGYQEVIIVEDECVDAPILFRGWIGDRNESRSNGEITYKSGAARFIDCNLLDGNSAAVDRLITARSGKRPAETDIQRIDAIVLSTVAGGLSGLVSDLGFVDRSRPWPVQENDYRNGYARDVLDDVASPAGRVWFVYTDQPSGDFGLFYDFPTSTVHTSPLSISNDMADTSDMCLYPLIDAQNHLDPSEVVSLVRFTGRNGAVIETDGTTYSTFFSAAATGGLDLGDRGVAASNILFGLESTLRTAARGVLRKGSVERSTITVSVILSRAKVGLIDRGQRVAVKFTHLTGYGDDFVYVRVVQRTIQQWITNLEYLVTYELSNDAFRSNGGGGGPGPGDFPHPPASSLSIIQSSIGLSTRTMPATPTTDDVLVVLTSMRGGSVPIVSTFGYTDSGEGNVSQGPTDYVNAGYKTVAGDSDTFGFANLDAAIGWYEIGPGATLVDHKSAHGTSYTAATAAVTIPAGGIAFATAGAGSGGGFDAGAYNGPPTSPGPNLAWQDATGWTRDYNHKVQSGHPSTFIGYYRNTGTADVSVTPSFSFYNDGQGPWPWQVVVIVFGPSAESEPPPPATGVPWEVVTMTTENGVSVGTTRFPYAARSLQVKVDGVLISTASYTETDPSCGDFALSWKIDPDEVVTVTYQGI